MRRLGQARPTSGRQPGADASGLRRSRREWSKAEQLAAYRGAVGERCHRHGSLDRTRRACRQRGAARQPMADRRGRRGRRRVRRRRRVGRWAALRACSCRRGRSGVARRVAPCRRPAAAPGDAGGGAGRVPGRTGPRGRVLGARDARRAHGPPVHVAARRGRAVRPDRGCGIGQVTQRPCRRLVPGRCLSQYLEPRYAQRLLADQPGGLGYLLKERVSDIAVLIDALHRVTEGECVSTPTIVSRLMQRSAPTPRSPTSLPANETSSP